MPARGGLAQKGRKMRGAAQATQYQTPTLGLTQRDLSLFDEAYVPKAAEPEPQVGAL